jgi:hypothetical protein
VRNRHAAEYERAPDDKAVGVHRGTDAEVSQWAPPDGRVP